MPTFLVRHQEEDGEQAVEDVDAIKMRNIRLLFSFMILFQTRSWSPNIIKLSGILLRPVPGFIKSIQAWVPLTSGTVLTHSLSGATTEVKSAQGTSHAIKTGEDLNYSFYTGRWSAQSFSVTGLPDGLTFKGGTGNGSITGTVTQSGQYEIKIVGYRYTNLRGSATPAYSLNLTVTQGDTSSEVVNPLSDNFSDLTELEDRWKDSWFGTLYLPKEGNWLFHSHIGWLYAQPTELDSFWFFENDLGWIYTSKALYPFMYRNSSNSWLYHLTDSSHHRFWDFSAVDKLL